MFGLVRRRCYIHSKLKHMKKFKVAEYVTVTVKKVYWAEAEDEEQALKQMLDGELGEAVTEKVLEEEVLEYEVKKVRKF
jgi:hypothetical protein